MRTIKTLGTKYPEIGRIRLGDKIKTKSGKEAPHKLETLRFTSNDDVALKALASQHGGDVVPWDNGEQAWQLWSETATVPIYLPNDPIDTTYERWGSGGCQRRCDGERCDVPVIDGEGGYLEQRDCVCLAEGRTPGDKDDKDACRVTVRLRLVLPDVPGIGIWLCTSHSIYAAMELPGQVALLEAMRVQGQLVPAAFATEKRREQKPWEKFAREFPVPVLRIRESLHGLGAASGRTIGEIDAPSPPELAAPTKAALPAAAPPEIVDKPPAKDSPVKPPPDAPVSGDADHVRVVKARALTAGVSATDLADMVAGVTVSRTDDVNELSPEEATALIAELKTAKEAAK